jgi:hypothetical protein
VALLVEMGVIRNNHKMLVGCLKGTDNLKDLGVDGRKALKWILQTLHEKM